MEVCDGSAHGFLFSDLTDMSVLRWGAAGALLLITFCATSAFDPSESFICTVLAEASVFSHLTDVLVFLAVAADVLQVASRTTVDPVLEADALGEVTVTLAAAPVLLTSAVDTAADFVVEVVLEMVALEEEVVLVSLGFAAVHLEVAAVARYVCGGHL